MKKVLFVATVTRHIIGFHTPYLKWFKEQGYEVHVASNGKEEIDYCDRHYNILFERFPLKKENIKAYKELKKIIEKNKYEIIHCHTPVGGVLARLAAKNERKKGTKVIYTAHGFHFYKGAPLLNWIIYYPIEKLMAKYTDCLITINEEDYSLAKKHLKIEKIELVHGVGVDEKKFDIHMTEKEKKELRKSLGLKEEDFVITYVAELNNNKNQIMIINAIKELLKESKYENVKVLLVGTGENRGILKDEIINNKLENNIFLLGYRRDVHRILKITNLYVSTSKREGLPVNLIEAMFAKVPIIATDCRGNRDIAKKTFEINNIEALKAMIIKSMKGNASFLCNKCEKYKLENVIKKMEQIYLEWEVTK